MKIFYLRMQNVCNRRGVVLELCVLSCRSLSWLSACVFNWTTSASSYRRWETGCPNSMYTCTHKSSTQFVSMILSKSSRCYEFGMQGAKAGRISLHSVVWVLMVSWYLCHFAGHGGWVCQDEHLPAAGRDRESCKWTRFCICTHICQKATDVVSQAVLHSAKWKASGNLQFVATLCEPIRMEYAC